MFFEEDRREKVEGQRDHEEEHGLDPGPDDVEAVERTFEEVVGGPGRASEEVEVRGKPDGVEIDVDQSENAEEEGR